MKIAVSGASGLVGSALVPFLRQHRHDVRPLVRGAAAAPGIRWEPRTGELDADALAAWDGPDAVVHLAGENIAGGRWTAARKERIRSSRSDATKLLCEALLKLKHRPSVFTSASAIGFYGDRADEVLTEQSPAGGGFLSDVTQSWEAASQSLASAGIRVVHLRFGMVLSARGGALAKMLPAFRAGAGGRLGSGTHWVSWIAIQDLLRTIEFVLDHQELRGATNTVAPNPATNADFTRTLAHVLNRPALLPVPAFVLRAVLGEMASELLLASQRVIPSRLLAAGFTFEFPNLDSALRKMLQRRPPD